MNILLVFLIAFVSISAIMSMHAAAFGWEFGEFQKGDVFVYNVCDYITVDRTTKTQTKCYDLTINIIEQVNVSFGTAWIAQVSIINDETSWNDVILIDDGFNIYSFENKYVSSSLSNTVFWLTHDAHIQSIDTVIGNTMSSTLPAFGKTDIMVGDFESFDDYTTYDLVFSGNNISGVVVIRDDTYLPSKASVFAEKRTGKIPLFSFELKSYSTPLSLPIITSSIPSLSVPVLETSVIPNLETFEIPNLETFEIPNLETFEIPDLETFEIPDLETFEIPDLETFEIPDLENPTFEDKFDLFVFFNNFYNGMLRFFKINP
ncbi:MAG: hypothetical protein K8Q89_01475 [Nitrosarchaeum sp.]|nr:hypothetical protein [Nitrosarchaeum sp.]